MSDVFDKIVERLKQKAKSGFEVVDKSEALGNVPATVCDVAYVCRECTDKEVCPFITEKQWVRLEDVEEAIQQLKQNYVITKKDKSTLEDCPHAPEIMQYICLICDKTVYYRRLSSEEAITKNEG